MTVAPSAEISRELHQRARFQVVRERIFDEMGRGSARWRLTWLLPYYVFVVALLIARGESPVRGTIQAMTVGVMAVLFVLRLFHASPTLKVVSFPIGLTCYFTLLATTGGVASPLLMTGAIIMTAAAFTLPRPGWLKMGLFLGFILGVTAAALFARTAEGALPTPLAPVNGWPTPEYVTIAMLGAVFTTFGVHRMGCTMSRGYEQAALELLERREELCSENENRTRALEGIAARLAHEVKNPLAAIKGLSTHMARNATDPKAAERLAIVAAEADRLQSIVEGFLSFSRGLDELSLASTKPYEVARELAVLLEARAQEAGVAIDVSGDEGFVINADARKLRQALLNVVLNAIQASPRGAAVRIGVVRDCQGARIIVEDEGVGMTPEVLDRIRKPYFTTKEGGTGLGVAVARGLIEQHGGHVEFKSAPSKGTTVTMFLPTKPAPCAMLPNPLRTSKSGDEREQDDPEPVPVGVP
jgi:signal transduction histidine kinase